MTYKTITVTFGEVRKITGPALQWQYNEKQYLIIKGLNLPEVYAVDFMNQGDTQTITMTPTEEGVLIPDQYLLDGRPLIAYIVVIDGESVNTIAQATFPVNTRGARTDMSPEQKEQQQIDQLIATMNEAVENASDSAESAATYAEDAQGHAQDAEANATLAESWAVGGTGTRENEDNDNAKHYAELAAQGAEESGYAWFDVDDSDGCMYVYISDNLSEDVSFAVNEAAGILEVTYN